MMNRMRGNKPIKMFCAPEVTTMDIERKTDEERERE